MASAPVVTWFGVALGAAMLWGLQYAFWGQILKSGFGALAALWWYCLFSFLLYSVFLGVKGIGIEEVRMTEWPMLGMLVLVAVIGFVANIGMMTGFQMANPTLVTMITASSPLFTAVFAYFLFKNVQVNLFSLVGFGLILAGVGVVAWSKQG